MSETKTEQELIQAAKGGGKVGAVLVVGGGIAAMQSSLDLADSGYQVYMVTNQPAIGGNMVRLDKTFPTNDCSMCIISPKLVSVGNHPNIKVVTMSDIDKVEGQPGVFRVTATKRARFVNEERCTGCGECVEKCPIQYTPQAPAVNLAPLDLKPEMIAKIDEFVEKNKHERGPLIPVLQDINSTFGYVPPESLKYVAAKLQIPLARVYHVATFYTVFSLVPRGEHIIKVCMGTACFVRGAQRILETLEDRLEIKAGETTKDLKFTIETVNCLGSCAMGPVVVADGNFHTIKPSGIDRFLKKVEANEAAGAPQG